MDNNVELADDLKRLDELMAELFPGTVKSDRVMIAVDKKMHIAIRLYARRRGWPIRWAVQNLLAAGFQATLKKEIIETYKSKAAISGL